MQVKDVMIKNVKTILKGSRVQEAAKTMTELRIGSLIVVDSKGRMTGIITESDILKIVSENKCGEGKVDDVMTKDVFYVKPQDDLIDAVEMMTENKIKKLPVIDKRSLVGIVTITDAVAAEPKLLDQVGKLILFSPKQKSVAG